MCDFKLADFSTKRNPCLQYKWLDNGAVNLAIFTRFATRQIKIIAKQTTYTLS